MLTIVNDPLNNNSYSFYDHKAYNYIAYLGCVVDDMSIMFHISKLCTKCNDKHMPMCFLLIYRHWLLAYKQYLFFHTLYTIQV